MTTEELDREMDIMRQEVIDEVMRNGGPSDDPMAQAVWVPPGPVTIPEDLPPEEKEELKRRWEEAKIVLNRYADRIEAKYK